MGFAALFGQVIQTGHPNIEMQGASEKSLGWELMFPVPESHGYSFL